MALKEKDCVSGLVWSLFVLALMPGLESVQLYRTIRWSTSLPATSNMSANSTVLASVVSRMRPLSLTNPSRSSICLSSAAAISKVPS